MKKQIRKNHIVKIHNDKDHLVPKYLETLESASKLPVPLINMYIRLSILLVKGDSNQEHVKESHCEDVKF